MERVIVTRPIIGLVAMQVCAINEATDEEVLRVANKVNPSGTTMGWTRVVRETDVSDSPVTCADDAGRVHLILYC